MNKNDIILAAEQFLNNSPHNYITKEIALSEDVVGMKIYESPIFTFGSASDNYFEKLKKPEAIGNHFMMPNDWLPSAKTVISYFLPFSKQIRDSNRKDFSWPSDAWLNARIDGQKMMNEFSIFVRDYLKNSGFEAVAPSVDSRFKIGTVTIKDGVEEKNPFTSNWSERHVAFVCGLGTFNLAKGMITKAGTAGRFGSVITNLEFSDYTVREYTEIYEYCTKCGACAKNCPADAITIENAKDHVLCNTFVREVLEKHRPYYGCGKCQVRVPCESGIPIRRT